jgi:hypothetical protein
MSEKAAGSRALRWLGWSALGVLVLGLVLAALVAFVVPGIARREASKGFEAATGRKLAIGDLSIHPFAWRVEIKDLSMSEVGGKGTFASFQRAEATVSPVSVLRGNPVISHVRMEGPHFNVIRTGPSTFNFSDLIKYLIMPVPALSLEDVAITGGSIDFTDQALPKVEKHTVRDAELKVPFLTTVPARAAEYGNPRFAAVIDGAPLVIETKVRGLPRAPEVSAQVDLKDLSLPVYLSYVPATLPVKVESGKLAVKGTASYRITDEAGGEVGWDGSVAITEIKVSGHPGPLRADVGEVSVRSRVTRGDKRGLLLEDGALEVRNLFVPFRDKDGVSIGLLLVQGARFSDKKYELEVASVLLDKGIIRVSRDRKGVFSPMPLVEDLKRQLPRGKATAGAQLRYRIGSFEGKGIEASFTDGMRKELPSFKISDAHFTVEDLRSPEGGKVPLRFAARWGKATTIEGSGWAVPTPLALDAKLEVKGFALADAGPYLPAELGLVVTDGQLDVLVFAALSTQKDRLSGTFGGSAAVRSLRVLDRRRGKLLAWDALTVDGMKGDMDPMRVQVGKVGLEGLRADLVMDKDGNLNLPRSEAAKSAPGAKPPAKAQQGARLESLRIDEFAMKDGLVNFTDQGVPGEFHATIRDISARVTGISSDPNQLADVQAQMTLPKGAPLRITGKAKPLRRPMYAELDLALEKLDLSTATPYSATYLGLEVDKGALTVKSRARVDQGKLAAENRIRVDQLTFGKSVKSDKATILPVQLIIDILRDRNGDIVLDLPVKASTEDENLVGTVVFQAAGEVVFPPGSPVRNIEFAPCSTKLSPESLDRLRKLATALQERPAMKVTAIGYVDRETDGRACREQAAAQQGAAPTYDEEASLKQLAQGRAVGVRSFLVQVGDVDPARVVAKPGDLNAPPKQKDARRARVEFARATD